MRPRSIAGPIILIGLGILFLINNIRPDFSFWQSLWRYWPFLLIAFGVLRLAEVLVDAGYADAPCVEVDFFAVLPWLSSAPEPDSPSQ